MENASKALIMAGSVLIALMIIGALLLMFNNLSSYQETNTQGTREAQIVEFNNQYETYNRKNVRGSDLYSLLNKVVDYNKRKSTSGIGENEEGQYIAYEPMTIKYTLDGREKELRWDDSNRIFKGNYVNYTLDKANTNDFETYIIGKINEVTDIAINETGMQNLASGISNLFGKTTEKDKLIAINLWNANAKDKTTSIKSTNDQYDEINKNNERKNKIYTYYEFMQFKRAKFDCIDEEGNAGVKYNEKTGRIIEMSFKFNGKIE